MRGALRSVLLGVGVLVGCGDGVPRPVKVDPVSMAEAEELARRFEAAMEPCDAGRVDPLVDIESLLRRAVATADAPPAAKQGFLRGARGSATVGATLCLGMNAGGTPATYDLLRIREVDGQPRPLFRLIGGDAVNYHELHLGKSRKDHKVRVLDLHIYMTGELLSETLGQVLEHGIASARHGDNIENASATMTQIRDANGKGAHAEVRRLVAQLPPDLRDSKPMRLMDLMAASELDETAYATLIGEYERLFPGDPSLAMVSIDGYYLRKNGPGALASIDRIDKLVGGDPYLGTMRASALILDPTPANLTEAERWAKASTDALPTHENGWWSLATVRLMREDHAGVVAVFERLAKDFEASFDLASMQGAPLYAPFLKSPEFAAWWKTQGGG